MILDRESFTSASGRYRLLELDYNPAIYRFADSAWLVTDEPDRERLDDALAVVWECFVMMPEHRRMTDGVAYVAREIDRIADEFARWFVTPEQAAADLQRRIAYFVPMFDDLDEQDNGPK